MSQNKPTVFISYSHKDEAWKDRLVTHLGVLSAQGLINLWQDRLIGAGEDWRKNIEDAMSAASIAVLLITANSLTSDFILNEEVPPLIQRHAREGVRIYPIIVEPCAWQLVGWLGQMNLRPKDGRPLSDGNENQINSDLAAIATEIYLLLRSTAPLPGPQRFVPLNPDYVSTSRLPQTGRELFGREIELKMLDGAWADAKTNVLSLIAWGGMGKSSLVNHWLRGMRDDHYRGAERIYAWSFYRQGTSEQGVSADQFIDAALRWFKDPNPTEGSAWDKGERLARLIKAQRTLLLLDGLEPLQYPPGPQEGRLKDQSMQALLRELAETNQGLCVITSRLAVTDLEDYDGGTSRRINLEHLSPQAGAEVLRAQKVRGDQAELEQASTEFGGHALALNLLGSYLHTVHDGDIHERDKVDILIEDEERGGHAQRVMAAYEKWFAEGPELNILRILGLFDRPADGPAINALRAAPAIPSLTDSLQNLTEEKWRRALKRLRDARLIADKDPSQPETLDTHPLVREYFRQQLKRTHPDAWREGNYCLYKHLKRTTKEFPDSIEEMTLLYAAMSHGCEAGEYRDALEIHWSRISRKKEFYSTNKLGAFGADLAAMTGFFDQPWLQIKHQLDEKAKAHIFNLVGFRLKALGYLLEAVAPMQAAFEIYILLRDWVNADIVSGNISTLYMTIGDLKQSLKYAEESVKLADHTHQRITATQKRLGESRSADTVSSRIQQMDKRTLLADIKHKAGQFNEAEQAFIEAEEMQKQLEPFPLLYSTQGFRYCDFLLSQGKYKEAYKRAAQTIKLAEYNKWLLDIALDHLILGQACLLKAQQEEADDFSKVTTYLNQAVDELRQSGRIDYLPLGLLARAASHRVRNEHNRARADLDEAMSIAKRSRMGLYEADCHLEYARLYLAEGGREKARESWAIAKEMVEGMGYGRRAKDVREIGAELGEAAG